jgi:drug/metabolite transporter (DMT)-like permease
MALKVRLIKKYIISISKPDSMKKQIFCVFCIIMLFASSAMAQQLSGESDPFVFDTRAAQAIPLSSLAVVITLLLAAFFMLHRFRKQKKEATV